MTINRSGYITLPTSLNRFCEACFLTASVNKKWLPRLMSSINLALTEVVEIPARLGMWFQKIAVNLFLVVIIRKKKFKLFVVALG